MKVEVKGLRRGTNLFYKRSSLPLISSKLAEISISFVCLEHDLKELVVSSV